MKNDSRIPTPRKNDKAGQTASRPITKRSRNRVESASAHAPKVGAGQPHATGRNTRPALADPVSRASIKAPEIKALTAPITVTITGNLAASVRFFAHAENLSVQEYITAAVKSDAHANLTGCSDEEAEAFLLIKEDAA